MGTVLGTALATAILVGALIVGDSVRYSLQKMVFERLGNTSYALELDSRNFSLSLADNLSAILETQVAPLLQTKGIASTGGGDIRANRVQVIGVTEQVAAISNTEQVFWQLASDEAIVNQQLAYQLDLQIGDQFLLRLLKAETFSRDAPLSRDTDLSISRRFKVKHISTAAEFGHFDLKSNQVTPYTVFVSFAALAKHMDLDRRANTMLIAERSSDPLTYDEINQALKKAWDPTDVGLTFTSLDEQSVIELKSDRIFLEPRISSAMKKVDPTATEVFTYFVNELHSGEYSTPYSFVSAPGEPIVPTTMTDNEIIVNRWLAEDLNVKAGESLTLSYYVLGPMRQLIEKYAEFRINSVVPVSGIYADSELMPDFPGLAGEENCRDWDPGIPVDFDKIRDKDEIYWDEYRGIPKAFVTLKTAQSLWENRFGNLTAIRIHQTDIAKVKEDLKQVLNPVDFGLAFQAVRQDGIRASVESVDFAELFLGLSFFIIVAAMILTGLLFVLSIEQRSQQTGLYLALGFPQKTIKRLIFYESGMLAVVGVVAGAIFGIFYNQIILFALKTVWIDAVGTTALDINIKFSSILIGIFSSLLIALFTIYLVIRKQGRQSVSGLQAGLTLSQPRAKLNLSIAVVSLIAGLVIIVLFGLGKGSAATGAFFGSGSLLLVSGIAFTSYYLNRMRQVSTSDPNLFNIGVRNASRAKTRSLLLVGLLASGLFIVFTVGANRHGEIQNADQRASGTGGFSFYSQTLIPVLYDLNSEKGRDFYGLEELDKEKVSFVPFKVKEGDDASCLNLNRVSNPQLIGVRPEALNIRNAFTFSTLTEQVDPENPWLALNSNIGDDIIPGIADETVIIWGLGKSVGDTLDYMDEKGKKFRIKLVAGLANSVFQGNIIISKDGLIARYPSVSGHRMFLVDCPPEVADSVSNTLSWAMQDLGIDITRTGDRLARFNEVENTYLSIFLILGGFGLILGTIGLGIVVMRNILERRGELALLKAVGFSKSSINKLIFSEHILLLVIGTACGFFTALIAVFPALITPGTAVPYITILITLLVILFSGCLWIYWATSFAVRGDLLPALRSE
jgi:ABC-type antimicrobial peptide transport system permease subunit